MKAINQKYPFYLSIGTGIFFTLYSLAFHFQVKHVLVGVFSEMLMIPAILAKTILIMYSTIKLITQKEKEKSNAYTLATLGIASITFAYVVFQIITH